jgi:hypothetical protein
MPPSSSGSASGAQISSGDTPDTGGEGTSGSSLGNDRNDNSNSSGNSGSADGLSPHLSTARHFSEARGGGFFFLSADGRYIIKSMTRAEHHTLLALLPHYCRHVRDNRRSLICRISGCYSITMYGQTKVRGKREGEHSPRVARACVNT